MLKQTKREECENFLPGVVLLVPSVADINPLGISNFREKSFFCLTVPGTVPYFGAPSLQEFEAAGRLHPQSGRECKCSLPFLQLYSPGPQLEHGPTQCGCLPTSIHVSKVPSPITPPHTHTHTQQIARGHVCLPHDFRFCQVNYELKASVSCSGPYCIIMCLYLQYLRSCEHFCMCFGRGISEFIKVMPSPANHLSIFMDYKGLQVSGRT